jgi:hypothetical protein
MTPAEAYALGYDTAAPGFFFDGMEMIAAVSPACGGIEPLRGGVELLFAERDPVSARLGRVAAGMSTLFGQPFETPTTVDEYRHLMTAGVFEVVNRWSYIDDIKTVNQLQAWFYAGFGLGRVETVIKGFRLFERLYEIVGAGTILDTMPERLRRLAAEAAKQLEVAGDEADLASVRPLLHAASDRAKHAAVVAQRSPKAIEWTAELRADLEFLADVRRKLDLDVAR